MEKSVNESVQTDDVQEATADHSSARGETSEARRIEGSDILLDPAVFGRRPETQTLLHLDPSIVRTWSGNPRAYEHLTRDNVGDLIHSIKLDGQRMPVAVRRVHDDPQYRYEVIAGTRRHFAVHWLRQHCFPSLLLVAKCEELGDQEAFKLADLENRARKDITDFERARSYAVALKQHFEGHQAHLAEQLGMSQGHLSKLIRLAEFPDAVVQAFGSISDITVASAYDLAAKMRDEDAARLIQQEAMVVAGHQHELRADQSMPIPAREVVQRLLEAVGPSKPAKKASDPLRIVSEGGEMMLTVGSTGKADVTVKINRRLIASREEWARAFATLMATLEERRHISFRQGDAADLSSMKD